MPLVGEIIRCIFLFEWINLQTYLSKTISGVYPRDWRWDWQALPVGDEGRTGEDPWPLLHYLDQRRREAAERGLARCLQPGLSRARRSRRACTWWEKNFIYNMLHYLVLTPWGKKSFRLPVGHFRQKYALNRLIQLEVGIVMSLSQNCISCSDTSIMVRE